MKKSINQVFTLLFTTLLLSSCSVDMLNRIEGNRNVKVEDRIPDAAFSEVKVSAGLDLFLSEDRRNSITVEADENLHDNIITEVENGILKIYPKNPIYKAKAKKVFVTAANFTAIIASSGSYVASENILNSREISFTASSGAQINVEVDSESIATKTSSGANIKISGNSKNHASNASSGSAIRAYNLKSNNVIAKASSGASINVHATNKIAGKASSGAGIDFKGDPKNVSKKTSSGGSVSGS